MTPEQQHHVYRWFEYSKDLHREENRRRHIRAAYLGALTALALAGLVYVLTSA